MQKYDVCVIGGGASGSMLAVLLAKNNVNVCVVDANELPAKKLLVTGNGKCNITNKNMSSKYYNQNIDKFLDVFGYKETIKAFSDFGLDIYADECGRCYPISNSAKTVRFVLEYQLKKYGVDYFNETVSDVDFDNYSEYGFVVSTDNQKINAKKVVLACGINEFALNFCKKFDIKLKDISPSLVALKTKQHTKTLDGKRIDDVLVTATCGTQTMTEVGEVLFKANGLSGICIFNLSSLFARNNNFSGKITVNLLKNYTKDEIIEKIHQKQHIFAAVQQLLDSMFLKELSTEILKRCDLKNETSCEKLNQQNIDLIVKNITALEFDVCGAYQNNQVFSGGVDLGILTDDLQSKQNKGIYFCGEICDIDGICGGYNLQWAWTSAYVVAQSILKRDK